MSLSFNLPRRRPRGESIVPMINVVFLLLIFFLLTSQLTPPPPFEVAPPVSRSGERTGPGAVLYLSAAGALAFRGTRGRAAIAALGAAQTPDMPPPLLRADAGTEAAAVARTLKALAAAGVTDVALVVAQE